MSELEMLTGKTLRRVSTEERSLKYGTDRLITFHCTDGDYVFRCEGDCCSQTYIDSVEGPQAGRIISVQEPGWGEDDGDRFRSEQDGEMKYYKATFAIENEGHLDIEYRNESNGYYGGSLELVSAPAPCTVHEDCAAHPELGAACFESTRSEGKSE